MPTVGFWIASGAVSGLLSFSALRASTVFAVLALFVVVISCISLVYLAICFLGCEVSLDAGGGYFTVGETAVIRINMVNRFGLPVAAMRAALYTPFDKGDGLVCNRFLTKRTAGASGVRGVDITELTFTKAGVYALRCEKIELLCPLGIFRIRSKAVYSATVFVMPQKSVLNVENFNFSSAGESSDRMRIGDSREEIYGISDYVPGDSLRDIHWKKSAANEDLQTVKYTANRPSSLCVAWDVGPFAPMPKEATPETPDIDGLLTDGVLTAAYGYIYGFLQDNPEVTLYCGGESAHAVAENAEESFASLCIKAFGNGDVSDETDLDIYDRVVYVTARPDSKALSGADREKVCLVLFQTDKTPINALGFENLTVNTLSAEREET